MKATLHQLSYKCGLRRQVYTNIYECVCVVIIFWANAAPNGYGRRTPTENPLKILGISFWSLVLHLAAFGPSWQTDRLLVCLTVSLVVFEKPQKKSHKNVGEPINCAQNWHQLTRSVGSYLRKFVFSLTMNVAWIWEEDGFKKHWSIVLLYHS